MRVFRLDHFSRQVSEREVLNFGDIYPTLAEGALLGAIYDPFWWRAWKMASPDGLAAKAAA